MKTHSEIILLKKGTRIKVPMVIHKGSNQKIEAATVAIVFRLGSKWVTLEEFLEE